MAASYPSSIITLPTINNGDTSDASNINTPNAEIVAIETGLLNGFQHDIKPLTDNANDLGNVTHAWKNIWSKGTVQLNGITYTFPAADGSANQFLQTNGSKVLAWATPVGTPIVNEFRLSLTTGVSVTTTDVTAATTLYCTPHVGRRMTTFDSSGNASTLTSAEISIAVPATTATVYSVFAFNNSGVLTLELQAWTNDTTPATAIVKTGALDAAGVPTKSGDTTRRFLGLIRTTGVSGQTEDSFAKRHCINVYNTVDRAMQAIEQTNSYNYAVATVRQARASAANQLDFLVPLAEWTVQASVTAALQGGGAGNFQIGIAMDSTTALDPTCTGGDFACNAAIGDVFSIAAFIQKSPAIGRHTLVWLENASSAANFAIFSNNSGNHGWSGIRGVIRG